MSLNETKNLVGDEFDLAQLFKLIWSFKYSLLIFIILSVPISVWVSTSQKPTFKAETVFEKPSKKVAQNSSFFNGERGMGFMSLLGGGLQGGASDSFFSEIRSESFLRTVILNNGELDSQMVQEQCPLPSKQTSTTFLRSLLISLGISENKDPSENQKISMLVQCVNNMLEINFDKHRAGKSSAYRLSIESGNPDFSANLANEIVNKYFTRHKNNRDENFKNVKKYLSKVITDAQLEFAEANKLMQNFKIKNTLLMNINPSTVPKERPKIEDGQIFIDSLFEAEFNREIANLSQLEKSLSQLKQAQLNLSSFAEPDQDNIIAFIASTEVQGVLSRNFVSSITKIDTSTASTSFKNKELKKTLNQELQSLTKQIQVLEDKITKREEKTIKLMSIENKFQELAIDVVKKKLIFESLKDQLKEKIITAGLASVEEPVLLTKAVPPFIKASPNNKMIVFMGGVLSIIAGIMYILIRQFFMRKVYSISQLRNLSRFLNCYEIKYRQLMDMGERSDETVISQSFFSLTRGKGKLGCIIDLSQKTLNNSMASKFSKTFASSLATNGSKIVCLDRSMRKISLSGGSLQKSYSPEHSDFNDQGTLGKNILMFNNEDDMIVSGDVKKIKNKYSEYDNIICALDRQIGDLTKFKFIEQCDFYILIGKSFHFDEYTYKKFSNTVWEKEQKCLGFFLID